MVFLILSIQITTASNHVFNHATAQLAIVATLGVFGDIKIYRSVFLVGESFADDFLDHVDLFQIHRWDYNVPIEETMEALHDIVKAGKARYIGASSMYAWQFAKAQEVARANGWTRFISMQNQLNLLYREEEREMLPLCADQGVGVIPWSPLARGRLTRPHGETTVRSETDVVGKALYKAKSSGRNCVVQAEESV